MVRVVVSGACGRTGLLVTRELASSSDAGLAGAVEAPGHECVGRALSELCPDAGGLSSDARVLASLEDLPDGGFDVVIDFSTPEQAAACATFAARTGTGLVVATTGLTEEHSAALSEAAARVAVVQASNTSVGANVLFALLERAGGALGRDFDIEIVETHHRGKRDAPSGTALTAAGVLAESRGIPVDSALRVGREGRNAPRCEGEIGVHSVRGGAVAGRHVVHFMSDLETLTLEHVALSRRAFAVGAVRAALFAAGARPGLYNMRDVLGLSGQATKQETE